MKTPESRPSKRKIRAISSLVLFCLVIWQVIRTEREVSRLRAAGFTDVVIDSTRNHAYFPLFGGILGAALLLGLTVAIKRVLRQGREDTQ